MYNKIECKYDMKKLGIRIVYISGNSKEIIKFIILWYILMYSLDINNIMYIDVYMYINIVVDINVYFYI